MSPIRFALTCSPVLAAASILAAGCATTPRVQMEAGLKPAAAHYQDPTAKTLYAMARVLQAQGKMPQAESVLLRLVNEYAGFVPSYSDLAGLRAQQGRFDEALAFLDVAIKLAPSDPVVLNNRGICLLMKGNTQAALESFQNAAAADTHTAKYRANAALALGMLQRDDECLEAYKDVVPVAEGQHNLEIIQSLRSDTTAQADVTANPANPADPAANAQPECAAEEEAAKLAAQQEAERVAAEEAAKLAAQQEAERVAAEEAAKLAAQQEAERVAAEEAAKLAAQQEAERLAAEEAAKLAAQQEAERRAAEEAAKLAAQQEAERLAAEEAARLAARQVAQELAAQNAAANDAEAAAPTSEQEATPAGQTAPDSTAPDPAAEANQNSVDNETADPSAMTTVDAQPLG